ncbi:MAG: sensor domain-containing diguanylate cyclase [Lachnospiraceae bacterium]|nr:sensor domain-containing diguanylate cyclase [Lachnospiraceae bacterium]
MYRELLENYPCKACLISVDIYPEGKYGNITVVSGNRAHAEEVEHIMGYSYVENVPYEVYFPQNMNFEDYCYRCAALKQQIHTYVEMAQKGVWVEAFFLPLNSVSEDKRYCMLSYNVSEKISAKVMSEVPQEVSAAVIEACVKLHEAKDFKECINEVIRDVRSFCEARRCCIILVDEETKESSCLADSLRPEYTAVRTAESMNKSFYSTAESWKETLAGSSSLIIKNEQDMEELQRKNPVWHEALVRNSVKTVVLFPLKYSNKLIGYIWATNYNVDKVQVVKGVMELVSYFIASRIANYLLVNKLEIMSTIDMLTGTKNRNAMNNRVSEFDDSKAFRPKSVGVIFADLNGLKQTNDVKGHEMGDRLLKKCAAILKQVFIDDDIYRAGGDEFMIILTDCSFDQVEKKIDTLRKVCETDEDVSFAVGWCYEDGDIDIRRAMSKADERMYADKKEYYKRVSGERT